jgi:phospholipid-binding lipoprotein MlaA
MRTHKTYMALALIMSVGTLGAGPLQASEMNLEPLEEVVVHDTKLDLDDSGIEDYDPWESFNEKMFSFNYKLDRYVIKPAATVYNEIVLDGEKQAIHNAYDNIVMPRRFINSMLQGKFRGAGRELSRFVINTTLGVGGLADVAKYQFHVEKSDVNSADTFGFYGAGPGPYLVLPFLPPFTVRGAVGFVVDLALDPMSYVLPFAGSVGKTSEDIVNNRAINLDKYQSVEEATLDLYSAVRNATMTEANSKSHKDLSLSAGGLRRASSRAEFGSKLAIQTKMSCSNSAPSQANVSGMSTAPGC